jgi:hypothetical protein
VILLAVAGCDAGPRSARGFRLPDGDVEKGKGTFVTLQCNTCHKVAGVELPAPDTKADVEVTLGGEVRRVRTYGELVTSVINPSHTLARGYPKEKISKDGESRMTNFNDVMTVSQLVDLVAFLQSAYQIKVDDSMYYPYAY